MTGILILYRQISSLRILPGTLGRVARFLSHTNGCDKELTNYLEVFQTRLEGPSRVTRQNRLGLSLARLGPIPLPTSQKMAIILMTLVRVLWDDFKEHSMSS